MYGADEPRQWIKIKTRRTRRRSIATSCSSGRCPLYSFFARIAPNRARRKYQAAGNASIAPFSLSSISAVLFSGGLALRLLRLHVAGCLGTKRRRKRRVSLCDPQTECVESSPTIFCALRVRLAFRGVTAKPPLVGPPHEERIKDTRHEAESTAPTELSGRHPMEPLSLHTRCAISTPP